MTYIRNAWYMIAWSEEITTSLFTRTILDMPILLYRDSTDNLVAMFDRCPHRFAPLSMGKRKDTNIQCGYHGLEFNSSGQCVRNPFAKTAPSAAKVHTFPIAERDGIIWIWPGDAAMADSAKITPMPHHTDPNQRCIHGLTTAKADYRLLSDNLMDLTHVAFLHPGFGGEHYAPKVSVSEDKDGVVADFLIERMPNFLGPDELPGEFVNNLDRIRWVAPSTHLLEGRTSSIDDPTAVWVSPAAHILTPETKHSTHYFWSSALPSHSSMSDEAHMALLLQTFDHEDKPMVEAVQRSMGTMDLWDMDPVLLKNDAGSVRVRRRIAALAAEEGATN